MRLLLKSLKKRGQTAIEPINTAVERTGSKALKPGKAVVSSKFRDAIAIPMAPSHGKNLFFHTLAGAKSSSAPNPSSQALVGSE